MDKRFSQQATTTDLTFEQIQLMVRRGREQRSTYVAAGVKRLLTAARERLGDLLRTHHVSFPG